MRCQSAGPDVAPATTGRLLHIRRRGNHLTSAPTGDPTTDHSRLWNHRLVPVAAPTPSARYTASWVRRTTTCCQPDHDLPKHDTDRTPPRRLDRARRTNDPRRHPTGSTRRAIRRISNLLGHRRPSSDLQRLGDARRGCPVAPPCMRRPAEAVPTVGCSVRCDARRDQQNSHPPHQIGDEHIAPQQPDWFWAPVGHGLPIAGLRDRSFPMSGRRRSIGISTVEGSPARPGLRPTQADRPQP